MSKTKLDAIKSEVDGWLEQGEALHALTVGNQQNSTFDTILALTSKFLRLGSSAGGNNIAYDNIKYIEYSGLWARINIGTINPRKRMVFTIQGKEWKLNVKMLAEKWDEIQNT